MNRSPLVSPSESAVRGTVGEAPDRDPMRIDGVLAEGPVQGGVDERDVAAIPTEDDVPCLLPRGRSQQDEARSVGKASQQSHAVLGMAPRTVEHQSQRRRAVRPVARGHVKQAAAAAVLAQRVQADRPLPRGLLGGGASKRPSRPASRFEA